MYSSAVMDENEVRSIIYLALYLAECSFTMQTFSLSSFLGKTNSKASATTNTAITTTFRNGMREGERQKKRKPEKERNKAKI